MTSWPSKESGLIWIYRIAFSENGHLCRSAINSILVEIVLLSPDTNSLLFSHRKDTMSWSCLHGYYTPWPAWICVYTWLECILCMLVFIARAVHCIHWGMGLHLWQCGRGMKSWPSTWKMSCLCHWITFCRREKSYKPELLTSTCPRYYLQWILWLK